jgi:hypothetical protein
MNFREVKSRILVYAFQFACVQKPMAPEPQWDKADREADERPSIAFAELRMEEGGWRLGFPAASDDIERNVISIELLTLAFLAARITGRSL